MSIVLPLLLAKLATAAPDVHAWPAMIAAGPDGSVDVFTGGTWRRRGLPETFVRDSGAFDGSTLAAECGTWHVSARGPLTWNPARGEPTSFPLPQDPHPNELRAAAVDGDGLWITTATEVQIGRAHV